MRLSIVSSFIFLLMGCQLTTPLAPLLSMPKAPELNSENIQIEYTKVEGADSSTAQIKSIQLPAHQINPKQTIAFDLSKAEVNYDLVTIFNEQFKNIGLEPVLDTSKAEYKLTLNKLSQTQGSENQFTIKDKHKIEAFINQDFVSQKCDSIDTKLSLRLTHTQSGDVVWFAQGELNSSEHPNIPLVYQFHFYQEISNQQQVSDFIAKHNTEEARALRVQAEVSIPAYQISNHKSELVKVSGVCSLDETNQLAPKISRHLVKTLVNKLKISDIKM